MDSKDDEIYKALINAGRKIEAIKRYREENNCGLSEACDYINLLDNPGSEAGKVKKTEIDESRLSTLLQTGKYTRAIKEYMDATGCTIKQAKEYIDNLAKTKNIVPLKSGRIKFEGCFIASVCYNGYDSPEVLTFRYFRDEVLLKKYSGKIFVKAYYFLSPKISLYIGKSEKAKRVIRKYFLDVILKFISNNFDK